MSEAIGRGINIVICKARSAICQKEWSDVLFAGGDTVMRGWHMTCMRRVALQTTLLIVRLSYEKSNDLYKHIFCRHLSDDFPRIGASRWWRRRWSWCERRKWQQRGIDGKRLGFVLLVRQWLRNFYLARHGIRNFLRQFVGFGFLDVTRKWKRQHIRK
jgi:hypothetical protein